MSALPSNVSEQQFLVELPDVGWTTHELPGNWEVRISSDGKIVGQNPDKEGRFRFFADVHTPVIIPEASLYPQMIQIERHTVDKNFSVLPNGDKGIKRNRKVTCGHVQPIFAKFGGQWHILVEENWRHGVIFTLNEENEVVAMHLTALKVREISRRSHDAFKDVVGYGPNSFESLNVNLFLGNTARNFGIRSLGLFRFKDQTQKIKLELPWENAKWVPVTEVAFDETPWIEIPTAEGESQIVPDGVLGVSYDIWAGYALWQIVARGYLPGLSLTETIPTKN